MITLLLSLIVTEVIALLLSLGIVTVIGCYGVLTLLLSLIVTEVIALLLSLGIVTVIGCYGVLTLLLSLIVTEVIALLLSLGIVTVIGCYGVLTLLLSLIVTEVIALLLSLGIVTVTGHCYYCHWLLRSDHIVAVTNCSLLSLMATEVITFLLPLIVTDLIALLPTCHWSHCYICCYSVEVTGASPLDGSILRRCHPLHWNSRPSYRLLRPRDRRRCHRVAGEDDLRNTKEGDNILVCSP